MEFKVGDIVEAFGMRGEIVSIDARISKYGYLVVRYAVENDKRGYFCADGRLESWHKAPALKLIERPKKKVKKYKACYRDEICMKLYVSEDYFKNHQEARIATPVSHKYMQLLESTEIEVEE